MRLEGKVVLVTGSATGIGEGIARRLGSEGAVPVIHGREEERAAGESLAAEMGGFFIAGELSDPESPSRIVGAALERFGRLDGLVNCAGVSWRGGIEASAEFFDRVIAINARAPFLMTQASLPHLKESGGSIVNIGSSLARQGAANMVAYSMSKAALANMTKALSGAFAKDGVRINGLNLGWTLTPNERALNMETSGWAEDWPETMGARHPFGRLLLPEDVAAMVAYLLSDEARMVTGQVWDFDQQSFGS
ncbi:SDR family oxidoreductase [bacterium]|nr:MAG: SDR family oxidoreductase [bacterium]